MLAENTSPPPATTARLVMAAGVPGHVHRDSDRPVAALAGQTVASEAIRGPLETAQVQPALPRRRNQAIRDGIDQRHRADRRRPADVGHGEKWTPRCPGMKSVLWLFETADPGPG